MTLEPRKKGEGLTLAPLTDDDVCFEIRDKNFANNRARRPPVFQYLDDLEP